MKAYGVRRSDTCHIQCGDGGCLERKYRHMRGHTKTQRHAVVKSPKSAARIRGKQALRKEE